MKKHFHDQFDGEKFYGFFRRHWITLIPVFMRFLFSMSLIITIVVINKYFVENFTLSKTIFDFIMLFAFAFSIFEIHILFLKILAWFLTIVIITDYRVIEIVKTIFTKNEKEGVDIKKIQDVQMRKRGLIRNMLGFGRIYLTLASITDTKEIIQVPKVATWVKILNHVRQSSIAKSISKKRQPLSSDRINKIEQETEEKIGRFFQF
jgi:hypothetical protein